MTYFEDEIPHGEGVRLTRPYRYFPGTRRARPIVHDIRFAIDLGWEFSTAPSVILAYRAYRDGVIEVFADAEFKIVGAYARRIGSTIQSEYLPPFFIKGAYEVTNEVGP